MSETLTARTELEEDQGENLLRPLRFAEFTGQRQTCDNLQVFVEAARTRGDALDQRVAGLHRQIEGV